MIMLNNDWDIILKDEFEKEYYLNLRGFLKKEYKEKTIYPPMDDIFNALKYTSYENTNVVILGQDPYINKGEAHGLAFSVQRTASIPPSLRNIFKELNTDLNCYIPNNGCLIKWAEQGVLLLNTVLTVEEKKSKSHAKKGWEIFTTNIIEKLNNKNKKVIFLLWGKDAEAKSAYITNPNHEIFIAAHPSPLAGGKYFGSKHFSKTNKVLQESGLKEIDWQIENK